MPDITGQREPCPWRTFNKKYPKVELMNHVPSLPVDTRVHGATASMTETGNAPQIRIYIKIEKIPEQSITINRFLILDLDCLEL